MKTSIKTFAAAIALSALVAGPASAMISAGQLNSNINHASNAGTNVFAHIDNGTVTINGYFADSADQSRVLRAAQNSVGVDKVINNGYVSN